MNVNYEYKSDDSITHYLQRDWACTQERSEPLHNHPSICFSLSVRLQMIYKIKHPVKWQLNPSVLVCWVNILWRMCENLITVEQGTGRLNELQLEYISHSLKLRHPWINVLFQFLTSESQPTGLHRKLAPVCISMTLERCPFCNITSEWWARSMLLCPPGLTLNSAVIVTTTSGLTPSVCPMTLHQRAKLWCEGLPEEQHMGHESGGFTARRWKHFFRNQRKLSNQWFKNK